VQHALSDLIFNTMSEGVLVWTPDARVSECNPAATRILARRREELVGCGPRDFKLHLVDAIGLPLSPDHSPSSVTLATERSVDAEIGLQRPDGAQLWLRESCHPLRDGTGKLVGAATTFVDVTSLRDVSQRLARIVDGANVGTWELDLRSGHVSRSEKWLQLLGYDADGLSPTLEALREIAAPADQHVLDAVPAFWASGHPYQVELRLRSASGAQQWVQIRGQATLDAAGIPVSVSGVMVDIGPRKQLEASLQASLEDNQQLVAQLRLALAQVKQLEGLLPICSFCKAIRDGENWVNLESFVAARSEATFSHGICPSCFAKHYPDV